MTPVNFMQQLELWSYDQRLRLTLPGGQDERIVIVDIDEKSLAEVGRWPWSRNVLARMMDQLFDRYGVAVVGFDVVFAEADTSSGIRELEALSKGALRTNTAFRNALHQSRERLDYDSLLASRFKGRPVVLGYYFAGNSGGQNRISGALPIPVIAKGNFNTSRTTIPRKTGYGANIPILQNSVVLAGHFNPDPDDDGVTRRVPMLQEFKGEYYESLSLAILRVLFGSPPVTPGFPPDRESMLEWLQVADLRIPVDASASALIPYRGYQGSFPYYSASDILNGTVPAKALEGAIVLVGTTAAGLLDLRSTPVAAVYAGVEIHANMIAGILDQNIKHSPYYTQGAEFTALTIGGLILTFWIPFLGPLASLALTVSLVSVSVALNLVAWRSGLVLPLASQLLLFMVLYAFNASYGFLLEARTKRQITGLFGQYVPPEIVGTMSRDPGHFTMEAESREMTVLFTDVVDFTSISETLEPKVLAHLMNEYLSAMTAIIYHYGGTIDKYIGDAIMAFWGAPLADPDHARHAVQSALAMQERMVALRTEFAAQGLPEIRIGTGINSGIMRVGNMGSTYRIAYTVMGDAVNLAARLEGLTRQYGIWIIAGQETMRLVPDVTWRELDLVRVKGKDEPVIIAEPIGKKQSCEQNGDDDITCFNNAVHAYRNSAWDDAEALLLRLSERNPGSGLYRLYLERISEFRKNPPLEPWDGVCTFSTK
jgi:adenylate cyclase